MQKIIPLSTIIILFASCNRYQYATISSTGTTLNDQQEFVLENDTLRLQYNFNGLNAPINMTIQNKLQVPISIDWQRSALIVNDKAISYVPSTVQIQGGFSGSGYSTAINRGSGVTSTSGSLRATASVPELQAFVPPLAYVIKTPMGVTNKFLENVPDSAYHKLKYVQPGGDMILFKKAQFTEMTSPLRFKSYLTVVVGEEKAHPVVYEQSFYVSELLNTIQAPETMWFTRGNHYYVKEQTNFGQVTTGFGVIAGTAVLSATAAALQPNEPGAGR